MTRALLALFALVVPMLAPVAVAQRQSAEPDPASDGLFRMALTGDAILTRRISPFREPEFLRMIDLIRGSDAAFTNLEMLFHDYEPWPMHESGGTYMRAEPALL